MKLPITVLICLVLVIPRLASAQVQIRVQESGLIPSAQQLDLNRQYGLAYENRDDLSTRSRIFQKAQADFWGELNRFLYKHDYRPAQSVVVRVTEYFQANGQADYVFLQFIMEKDTALPNQGRAVALMQEFYDKHRLSVNSSLISTPFRVEHSVLFGQFNTEPRRPLHGPGIISDLETARRTIRPDTVRELDFRRLELKTVPDVVYRFAQVEHIDLSGNDLTQLPAAVTALPKLARLGLMNNKLTNDSLFFTRNRHLKALTLQKNLLTTVPTSVRQNRRLESLWLGNNELSGLTEKSLKGLRRLTDLNLYNATLTELPRRIGKLRRLQVLDVYYNTLTTLPRQLRRLRRLTQLAVSNNQLKALPESLGRLRRLTDLYAHHNQLGALPTALGKLQHLRVLDLGYNWFSAVPVVISQLFALEELDLSNNNVQDVPAQLSQLRGLKKLYLRQNPFIRDAAHTTANAYLIDQLEANQTEVFH